MGAGGGGGRGPGGAGGVGGAGGASGLKIVRTVSGYFVGMAGPLRFLSPQQKGASLAAWQNGAALNEATTHLGSAQHAAMQSNTLFRVRVTHLYLHEPRPRKKTNDVNSDCPHPTRNVTDQLFGVKFQGKRCARSSVRISNGTERANCNAHILFTNLPERIFLHPARLAHGNVFRRCWRLLWRR